ncbi:hypothetical protein S7711_10966 [Stachybotrys chartarum IBT 7711]|uniref:Uncharacterized protein n=1 Tax=Stachybotrys chartarum (strain CBS 109288 / IBT 7711) TaxID=1280523 RepID=A0A084AKB8_STACB|nr:hypothetical protein S7711_10966 [Stachybotrys chartarum IBT 7711]
MIKGKSTRESVARNEDRQGGNCVRASLFWDFGTCSRTSPPTSPNIQPHATSSPSSLYDFDVDMAAHGAASPKTPIHPPSGLQRPCPTESETAHRPVPALTARGRAGSRRRPLTLSATESREVAAVE